ncbi:MAG TPA: feruloyl-CoA synthase [Pusillimonas sp.]|mgnify:FL=1|nr:feruloyl-CoA synthase [Pusillimonas sp.]
MVSMRSIELGPRGDVVSQQPDGSLVIGSPERLGDFPDSYTERLAHWAKKDPDRLFLAQRNTEGGWRKVTYGEAYQKIRSIAQALLEKELSQDRPLAILSGNSIEHALMALAAMHVGIVVSPISVAFSLLSRDYVKLRHVLDLLKPGMVFVDDLRKFEPALKATLMNDVEVVAVDAAGSTLAATNYDVLEGCSPTDAVDTAAESVNGDTIAKVLFTSGSSALPKGAINTHRMMCANQQMASQTWPFLNSNPPVLIDWLPWNHTFGGNFVFGLSLYHGGSFYLDDGKPMPGEIEKSLRNLLEISPTLYFGVPKMYELLLLHMEKDPSLRESFFSQLQMIFYAAAGMPEATWHGLRKLSIETLSERVFMTTTLGSTETGPLAITANWDADFPNVLGLPVPGVEVKLVPVGRKQEMRVKGLNITPGYWKQPELTAKAFDEDGWYCIGDAVAFLDRDDPAKGLIFDGRIAEDYKLSTGTWVNAGPLRFSACNEFSPLVRDVLPVGHDRDEVGLLVFPEVEMCRQISGQLAEASVREILAHEAVRKEFQQRLNRLASRGTSSVNTVTRIILVEEPLTGIELTDKNTLSFNVVLERRATDVVELYEKTPSSRVIMADVKRVSSP